jgi:hypothetical protein
MKILKKGTIPKVDNSPIESICMKCSTLYEYVKKDLTYGFIGEFTSCPVCEIPNPTKNNVMFNILGRKSWEPIDIK